MKRYFFVALVSISLVFSFAYGVAVGHYRFFPFIYLYELKSSINSVKSEVLTLQQQFFQNAFTREAPSAGLIYLQSKC